MDLITALFLFPAPVFGLLSPAIQQLSRSARKDALPYWALAGLLISLGSALVLLLATPRPPVFLYNVLLIG